MRIIPTENRRVPRGARRRAGGVLVALASVLMMTLPALGTGNEPVAVEPVASIEKAAHSYVESLLPSGSAAAQITVLPIDSRLRLARCASALAAQLPPGANLAARSTVNVSCAGPVHWSVYVSVVVESRIAVLVLKHAVARLSRVTADDVTLESRLMAGTVTAYLGSVTELTGRTARRPLAIGTALSVDMFDADTVIHRGQEVTLVAAGGAIEIRAAGRAMTDAPAGARIQVQNLSSMTVVEGVVESADVVKVAL